MHLTPEQIRVLGCLLKKERTTPDAYPLSLNGLLSACNQTTNRGRKEARWAHLLGDAELPTPDVGASPTETRTARGDLEARVAALETAVAELRERLDR